jgi:tetratricopeptide (TPR) repeat protein
LLRAEALLFLGRSEEALVILDELREVAEGEILADIFFLEGLHYEQQEQHERMYFALAASLRENPSHTDALEHYWKAVEHCRKHEEAIDLIEELLEARPYSSTAWFYLGNAHAYEGRYAEAIDCYEYAYLSDENFEHALRECAELCYTTQAYNRALGHFQELMERFEVDGEVLLRIGQCHQSLGRYRMARTFLHQALQYDPLNDEIFFHIGICHAREEDWQQAARYFRKAIHIEGEQDEYHLALAEAYRATGKITQAKRHYELAAELSPETANYWVRFAFFLIEARRGAEALKVLDQADEHVFSPELAYCRVACLFLIGRRQEACYWLSEALSEEFDAHNLLFEFVPELEGDTDVIALISIYTC